MWFRRIFRRRRRPPPLDLSGLDRLEELVARVAGMVREVALAASGELPLAASGELPLDAPAPAGENDVPAALPEPTVVPSPPPAGGCVLFLPGPEGYRLLEREHEPPLPGERIEVEGASFCVLRLGPSPLPGDRRRCAFLER